MIHYNEKLSSRKKVLIKYAIFFLTAYLVTYAFYLLLNFLLNNNLLVPTDYLIQKYSYLKYQILLFFSLIGGLSLLASGLSLILWGNQGRFIGISALILTFLIHGIQIDLLLEQVELNEYSKQFLPGALSLFVHGASVSNLVELIGGTGASASSIKYYMLVAFIFPIGGILGLYFLSRPTTQEYLITSQNYIFRFLRPFSQNDSSKKKGILSLKTLSYLMMTAGIISMILGIAYKLLYPKGYLFWVVTFALFMTFSFMTLALFLSERRSRAVPYAISFFILLSFYLFYRLFVWPEPYLIKETFSSLVQKQMWSMLIFVLLDLFYLFLGLVIIGYGLHTLLINKNVLTLFHKEEEKRKLSIY